MAPPRNINNPQKTPLEMGISAYKVKEDTSLYLQNLKIQVKGKECVCMRFPFESRQTIKRLKFYCYAFDPEC